MVERTPKSWESRLIRNHSVCFSIDSWLIHRGLVSSGTVQFYIAVVGRVFGVSDFARETVFLAADSVGGGWGSSCSGRRPDIFVHAVRGGWVVQGGLMTGRMTGLGAESAGPFFESILVSQSGFYSLRCAIQDTHTPAPSESWRCRCEGYHDCPHQHASTGSTCTVSGSTCCVGTAHVGTS